MILNSDAPNVNEYENWSPELRALASDLLQKDPQLRIETKDLLKKHAKFFQKSQS